MTNIFVTADTHFGHDKLFNIGERPLGFETDIIKDWNNIVSESDCVIHLGDFAMGRFGDFSLSKSIFEWRRQLRGNIILVRGNHDNETVNWYLNNGFQFCVDSFEIKFLGKKILFSHEPVKDFDGDINIHGHLHGNEHRLVGGLKGYPWGDSGRYIDMSRKELTVPMSLNNILKLRT